MKRSGKGMRQQWWKKDRPWCMYALTRWSIIVLGRPSGQMSHMYIHACFTGWNFERVLGECHILWLWTTFRVHYWCISLSSFFNMVCMCGNLMLAKVIFVAIDEVRLISKALLQSSSTSSLMQPINQVSKLIEEENYVL